MFGAMANFATPVTGCVGKADGLVDGLLNKALQEPIGGVSSPGTIYITSMADRLFIGHWQTFFEEAIKNVEKRIATLHPD